MNEFNCFGFIMLCLLCVSYKLGLEELGAYISLNFLLLTIFFYFLIEINHNYRTKVEAIRKKRFFLENKEREETQVSFCCKCGSYKAGYQIDSKNHICMDCSK